MQRKIVIAIVIMVASMSVAMGQVRFGLKMGASANSLKYSEARESFTTGNGGGFHLGAMVEFTVPIVGFTVDASAMYVRLNGPKEDDGSRAKRDIFSVPIQLKYKLSLGPVGKIIKPMAFTGPEFSVLMSKDTYQSFSKKDVALGWNFGFGAEVVSHVQVTATYHVGLTNVYGNKMQNGASLKDRYWAVTAAYLF